MATLAIPSPQSHFAMLDQVYNPKAYDTLAPLRHAHNRLTPDVMEKLRGPVRKVFLNHIAEEHYGIILLHNHFQMAPHQRLVEHGPISIPWNMGDEDKNTVSTCGGIISPRSFRLFEGRLAPFEFAFSSKDFALDEKFLGAAFRTIQALGLDKIFGIRCFDTYDTELTVEITQGFANVMVPRGAYSDEVLFEAFWVFTQDDDGKCHCRGQCFPGQGVGGGHLENHSCG